MDTIFVVKGVMTIQCDSLIANKLSQIPDSVSTSKSYADGLSCSNGVFVTAIICGTILLIAYWIYLFYKKKYAPVNQNSAPDANEKYDAELKKAIYQELKLYRSQLANFMEKQAISKETKGVEKEEGDKEISQKYIDLLKEYINELSTKLEKMTDAPEKTGPK